MRRLTISKNESVPSSRSNTPPAVPLKSAKSSKKYRKSKFIATIPIEDDVDLVVQPQRLPLVPPPTSAKNKKQSFLMSMDPEIMAMIDQLTDDDNPRAFNYSPSIQDRQMPPRIQS